MWHWLMTILWIYYFRLTIQNFKRMKSFFIKVKANKLLGLKKTFVLVSVCHKHAIDHMLFLKTCFKIKVVSLVYIDWCTVSIPKGCIEQYRHPKSPCYSCCIRWRATGGWHKWWRISSIWYVGSSCFSYLNKGDVVNSYL